MGAASSEMRWGGARGKMGPRQSSGTGWELPWQGKHVMGAGHLSWVRPLAPGKHLLPTIYEAFLPEQSLGPKLGA